MDYLDDIKIVREFLINIKDLKGTSTNFDKLKNNFNGLLNFILEQKLKLALNKRNNVFNEDLNEKNELEGKKINNNNLIYNLILFFYKIRKYKPFFIDLE